MKIIVMTIACLVFTSGCKSPDQKMAERYGLSQYDLRTGRKLAEANGYQNFAEAYGYQSPDEFYISFVASGAPRYSSGYIDASTLDLDRYSDYDLAASEAGGSRYASVEKCVRFFKIEPTGNREETIRLISEQGKIIRGKFQLKIDEAKARAKRESEKRLNDARRRIESTYGSESERNRGDWKALGVHREFERNPAKAAERLREVEIRLSGIVRGFGTTYDSNLNEILVVKLGGADYEDEYGFKTVSIIGTPSDNVPNKNSFWSVRVKLIGQSLNTPVFQYLGW